MLLLAATIYLQPGLAQTDSTIQTNVPALRDVFAKDFRIGCLLSYRNIGFSTDPVVPGQSAVSTPNGGYLIKFHMNNMSPGNNMKPQYTVNVTASAAAYNAASTSQAKDSIDTHPIISFNGDMIAQLNWAQRQGFTFRAHTLVWHSQTPTNLFRTGYSSTGAYLTIDKMTQRMDFYIHEIFRLIHQSWPGLLVACDVVNEAIDDNTGAVRTSGNEWYTVFGDSTYIMKAFQLARAATTQYGESQIKLYYNDYSTETAKKADGIVRLVTPIYQAGYLDGIGMQEHNNLSSPTAQAFIDSYNKFYPVCSEMSITELDVAAGSASPSASTLTTQANQYAMLFKSFVERSYKSGRGKIISVSKDGLNDANTFQTNQSSSLWDSKNQCKPAFYSVVNVGFNYHTLDSLIACADTIQRRGYTDASWSAFLGAQASAKTALVQNYSTSSPADAGLGKAFSDLKTAIYGLTTIVSDVSASHGNTPIAFELGQNYPNPFNPTTQIEYSVAKNGCVSLKVYDLLGQEVATLVQGFQQPGTYRARFDGSGLASGIYLYRLVASDFNETKRLVLLR